MGTSRWIAAAALAAGGMLVGSATQAVTASVYVHVAPPAPRYEVVAPARHGYAWVPGHWQWQGHGHVWVNGYYVRERAGYHYNQAQWYRYGDRWAYAPGGWVQAQYGHDSHHGQYRHGRRDRDLDNDGRPNRYDRDMDGDGVPNRHDRDPDNRRRY